MYEPNAFVVEGFPPAMPAINRPPIGLTDQEILSVIAALQTLGGTPTVTMQTMHRYLAGAPGVAPAEAAPEKGARLRPAVPPSVFAMAQPVSPQPAKAEVDADAEDAR